MADITPIGRPNGATLNPSARANKPQAAETGGSTRGDDSVEFSAAAQLLSKLSELPDVRQDLVDRVRSEIAAGTYDTDDKVDALLDELNEDL